MIRIPVEYLGEDALHWLIAKIETGNTPTTPVSNFQTEARALIDRLGISLYPNDVVMPKAVYTPNPDQPHYFHRAYGRTIEIAAVRSYVDFHLGDFADVPRDIAAIDLGKLDLTILASLADSMDRSAYDELVEANVSDTDYCDRLISIILGPEPKTPAIKY